MRHKNIVTFYGVYEVSFQRFCMVLGKMCHHSWYCTSSLYLNSHKELADTSLDQHLKKSTPSSETSWNWAQQVGQCAVIFGSCRLCIKLLIIIIIMARSQLEHEKVMEYAMNLKKLFRQAYPEESVTSGILLQRFVMGLKTPISKQLLFNCYAIMP